MTLRLAAASALALVVVGAGCGASNKHATSASDVKGVLEVAAGSCGTGTSAGSWFRMVQSGGSPDKGPFVANGDSTCADKSTTPLQPGADGGLRVGAYQPEPNPPFGADGASRSSAVIKPVAFFAVPFGISTNATDPQTGRKVPVPRISIAGNKLTADLSAVSVSWNGQHFNQGAPKPGAKGQATGTYNDSTGRYSLDWTSAISGGPFNGFIGLWHLEGTFRRSA